MTTPHRRRLRPNAVAFLALTAAALALTVTNPEPSGLALAGWHKPLALVSAPAALALIYVSSSAARAVIAAAVATTIGLRVAGLVLADATLPAVLWTAIGFAVVGVAATDAELTLRDKLTNPRPPARR